MRSGLFAFVLVITFSQAAIAQEDKKTDDDKPADPETTRPQKSGWRTNQRLKLKAQKLPFGKERDELIRQARQAQPLPT